MPSSPEPWERTLEVATRRLARGNRVMLDDQVRSEFAALLRTGCQRATAEGRDDDYERAGEEFVARIAEILQERGYDGRQEREGSEREPQPSSTMLTRSEFGDAVASLCPGFWPFC